MLDTVLTLLFPLIAVAAVGKISLRGNYTSDFMSKDYCNIIKGVCCIFVVMVHFPEAYQNRLQDVIGSFAYIAVTYFFLFSAYGMSYSVDKNASYLKSFWRNRLLALLVPCVIINIVQYAFIALCSQNPGDFAPLYDINRYVTVLLCYCLYFYIVSLLSRHYGFRQSTGDAILISGVIISSLASYFFNDGDNWCYERLGLVWGILLLRHKTDFESWMTDKYGVKTTVSILISLVLGALYLKYKPVYFFGAYLLKIVLGASIIVTVSLVLRNIKVGSYIGRVLGKISYSVYLIHGGIMLGLSYIAGNMSSGAFIAATYIVVIAFSLPATYIADKIVGKYRKRSGNSELVSAA